MKRPFWRSKSLDEMSRAEWESLCDGCGRCCLQKYEDTDTEQVLYTNLACHLLDTEKCSCTDYGKRTNVVPSCIELTPQNSHQFKWLPDTCAYRLIAQGSELYWWHPLVSGDGNSVHSAGISVRGKCVSEEYVNPEQWEDHIIKWVTM